MKAPRDVNLTPRRGAGVAATWWYTVIGAAFGNVMLVFSWWALAAVLESTPLQLICFAVTGAVWAIAVLVPLWAHNSLEVAESPKIRPAIVVSILSAFAFSASAAWVGAGALIFVMPIMQSIALFGWHRGMRFRIAAVVSSVLIIAAVLDLFNGSMDDATEAIGRAWGGIAALTVLLPTLTVVSLWWWDVVSDLDRSRISEARLAATQERLRVANDVHDLQGHHLQVIALQLELADRLIDADPGAAREQIKLARTSVDEARQGTRDLATTFRSIPLGDELRNAADLLRAAGHSVSQRIPRDADSAPAGVLGPSIRETTANILRHGGGESATLSLRKENGSWIYEVSNDADARYEPSVDSTGIAGLRSRAQQVRGSVDTHFADGEFTVVVTVPAEKEAIG